jgi:transcriptional regulator GlxA family with amidase domain
MKNALFICYPRALFTAISLPMEMINAASRVARLNASQKSKHKQLQKSELYIGQNKGETVPKSSIDHQKEPWLCHIVNGANQSEQTIETTQGLWVKPKFNLDNAPQADTIFLPPIWGNPEAVLRRSKGLLDWLATAHENGIQLVAVGTAVCFLAELGLLDNKVATTHWYYFDRFEQRYPQVKLQRHHFITQADNLYTTGSINSLIDLVLYFINQTYGDECAKVIEQQFNHEISRTYDKPWYSSGAARHPDEGIVEVQQWMQSHYAINFTLKALAELANMSERTFSRRFKNAVGQSPLAYGNALKMQTARELLKDTNLNNSDIADHLGFKESDYFIRLFKQKNGMTPGQYRKMVRGKLFSA